MGRWPWQYSAHTQIFVHTYTHTHALYEEIRALISVISSSKTSPSKRMAYDIAVRHEYITGASSISLTTVKWYRKQCFQFTTALWVNQESESVYLKRNEVIIFVKLIKTGSKQFVPSLFTVSSWDWYGYTQIPFKNLLSVNKWVFIKFQMLLPRIICVHISQARKLCTKKLCNKWIDPNTMRISCRRP